MIVNGELFKTDKFPNKQNLKRKIFVIAMTMEARYVGKRCRHVLTYWKYIDFLRSIAELFQTAGIVFSMNISKINCNSFLFFSKKKSLPVTGLRDPVAECLNTPAFVSSQSTKKIPLWKSLPHRLFTLKAAFVRFDSSYSNCSIENMVSDKSISWIL